MSIAVFHSLFYGGLSYVIFQGNLKWGFNPPGVTKVGDVERMQTKWDRDHDIKMKVR
jgi:hypothetical protein